MGTRNNKTSDNTHWRTFRGLAQSLCKIENIDISSYNFDDAYCYRTLGSEMQGSNVSYFTNKEYSCFVGDNKYDIYEVPSKSSSSDKSLLPIEGEKLCFAYNENYKYWLFTDMEYYIDNDAVKNTLAFSDSASFSPYGVYFVDTTLDGSFKISKKYSGVNCDFGTIGSKRATTFDSIGSRKSAYKTSENKIVNHILGIKSKKNAIIGKQKTKVYKKSKKKK